MSKKERNSNIELLRIVSMFMIVTYHIVCHCVTGQLSEWGGYAHPIFYKRLRILDFIMPLGPVGNAIFIMISGYFMILKGANININKISQKLLFQLGFATTFLTFGSTFIYHLTGNTSIRLIGITAFNEMAWFTGYYFIIVLVAFFFLNKFLIQLNEKNFVTFLLIIFALIEFGWSGSLLDGIGPGIKTIFLGIFLYSLGSYIQLFDPFKKIRTVFFLLIITMTYILIYISIYNNVQNSITSYFGNGSENTFIQSINRYDNASIIVMLIAISIFEIFRRMHIPNVKFINFIGQATFMIYLIHDNSFFYSLWSTKDWIKVLQANPFEFIFDLVKWAFVTFTVGIFAYIIYLFTKKLFNILKTFFINP